MSDDEGFDIDKQKKIEYYSACVNAWFNTRLEYDKSILVLSTGGVGVLLGFLNFFGVKSYYFLVLYILSFVFFLVALCGVLAVYINNASHIEEVISGKNGESLILSFLDKVVVWAFAFGVFFAGLLGVSVTIQLYKNQEVQMGKEQSKRVIIGDSFNGLNKLNVSGTLKKSFNGVANIQPKPAEGQPNPAQTGTTSQDQTDKSSSEGK
jgi:hypothetical protein